MRVEDQAEVLKNLKQEFEENGYEVVIEDEKEQGPSLKVLVDKLGKTEAGAAIFELSFVQKEALGQLQGINVAQYFITFDVELCEEKKAPILNALNQLNLTCALGSFQIFDEEKQLYYKYNGLVTGNKPEQMKICIMPVVNWILAMLDECYDGMKELVRGEF